MRLVPIFLFLSIIMCACGTARKVQNIEQPAVKVDTTVAVEAETKPAHKPVIKPEAVATTKDVFEKVLKNNIDFSTFSAKASAEFQQGKEGGNATAFIRIKKDSTIWLSLRFTLGIEGARILITRDSIKMMNFQKKNIAYRSINYLEEISGIPLDFVTLQDLIVGNPIFIDSNIVSNKVNANNELEILMNGRIFKHLLSLDSSDLKILHSKLDDNVANRNRSCDITYSDYKNDTGGWFSTVRKISVAAQSKLEINLDFKQYSFNQSLTFPFNIPRNYKRI
ncbi:DUF4292 domain-containing protein [Segetibacter sp.]|uniref:DUF4292 domain-containing protein n=1 Tax=Segetibacter sp. TaxID=2231182 RepID=UPI00261D9960|nr:DUF4292 domain-containing protein [Segetibacter sp.]MCW3081473.1 hypothetical protein [Segetibacter sp.]